MKKTVLMSAALAVAIGMTSCKSSQSAYRKAYEKAQEQATTQTTQTSTETTTPVATTPVATTAPVVADNSNVSVRTENVSLVNGSGLKAYSVVVGSFGVQANADVLQGKLKSEGYDAQVVKSPSNMYRVIISTHADKSAAVTSRNSIRERFVGAWLLYSK